MALHPSNSTTATALRSRFAMEVLVHYKNGSEEVQLVEGRDVQALRSQAYRVAMHASHATDVRQVIVLPKILPVIWTSKIGERKHA